MPGRRERGTRLALPLTLSLRNRLTLFVFAVTLLAIAALYVYVVPGLQGRLISERLARLAAAGERSPAIAGTVGSSLPPRAVQARVDAAGLASGDRVTLLLVAGTPGGVQLSPTADSSKLAATATLRFPVAYEAARSGYTRTGTERTADGTVAEAAVPVIFRGRPGAVIVYSAPVSDIVGSVALVRHEIIVAGAIALLIALAGGFIIARVLAQRLRRLELAAQRVAAGGFRHRIEVTSNDELGRLAVAFNTMQRQLEQLDLARKKFIATASHELRTPIFSLGGFVELLEDPELDAETRSRFLEQLRLQVERLRKLSVDLLDLSRLESGLLELRPEQVDIAELARSVSGEFEPALAQHDSDLELHLGSGRLEATCDPVRFAQIMRILIDNALTHTPSGTSIRVSAGREEGILRLAIRDDGSGIDPQALPRVFEPFYTADDAQGSGLGLAIASELAERMEGKLSVTSNPGETTFELKIPA